MCMYEHLDLIPTTLPAKSLAMWWHLEPQKSGGGHSHIPGTHWLGNLVYSISSRLLRDPNLCMCRGVIAPGE